MKVFEASQIREIDEYTIRHEPVASIDLMEEPQPDVSTGFPPVFYPGVLRFLPDRVTMVAMAGLLRA